MTAAMAMQSADVAPTASEAANASKARTEAAGVMAKWNKIKTSLTSVNAKLKAAGQQQIEIPK